MSLPRTLTRHRLVPLALAACAAGAAAPELAAQATEQSYLVCPWYKPANYWSTALASGNDWLITSAPRDSLLWPIVGHGAVSVHRRDPVTGDWNFETQLLDDDPDPGASFGSAIAFDGTTAVIGAPAADQNFVGNCGSVELFSVSGTTWTKGQELVAPTLQTSANFGHAVALAGGLVAVGAYDDFTAGSQGVARTYRLGKKKNGPWHLESELVAGPTWAEDDFGSAIAIDAKHVLVASRYADTSSGYDSGAIYLYDQAEFTLSVTPTQPAPGAPIDLEAHRGAPGAVLLLAVEAIDGVPVFIDLLYDVFAADYRWQLQLDAPDPALGVTVSVRACKVGAGGPLVGSQLVDVDL